MVQAQNEKDDPKLWVMLSPKEERESEHDLEKRGHSLS
jgi:hypothetical protein